MIEGRKKPGVALWATVVLVVALVGYPLSFGPACWITSRQDDPHEIFETLYFPLCKVSLAIDEPVWGLLVGYGGLGMAAGSRLSLPTGQTGERLTYYAAIDK